MDALRATYTTGAGIFGACGLLTGAIFIYFVWRGRVIKSNASVDHVHWLNSIWIYLLMFTNFLLLTALYATNSVGYGFYVKANLHVINWARWLVIAVVGTLFQGCLAYILTNDHRTWNIKKKKTHMGAQNFFILFYYAVSQFAIFCATITTNRNGHILCMVASIFTFIISMLLYFFPDNKITIDNDSRKGDDYVFIAGGNKKIGLEVRKNEEAIMWTYRITFLVFLVLAYVINFIIWFLSRSNDISDTISLQSEAIAYLVSDFVFIVPFALIFIGLTFYYKMKTLAIKDATTKTVTFSSQQQQQLERHK